MRDPSSAFGDPKIAILLPIIDQNIAWGSVQGLLPGSATTHLHMRAEMFGDPCALIVRSLFDGSRHAGQNDRVVMADRVPQQRQIGHRRYGAVETGNRANRLPIDVIRQLIGSDAEHCLMMRVEIREHAVHVNKKLQFSTSDRSCRTVLTRKSRRRCQKARLCPITFAESNVCS
jgi:hypothetical protein